MEIQWCYNLLYNCYDLVSSYSSNRSMAVSPLIQLLVTLRVYATGMISFISHDYLILVIMD